MKRSAEFEDYYANYNVVDLINAILELKKEVSSLNWELDNYPDGITRAELLAMDVVEKEVIVHLFKEKLRQTPEQFEKTLRQFFIDTIDKRL